ncbi:ATP-binding protein [Paenibacillus sp. JX-17]|uniref:histidine kinase n=1 Tax=Paenibacillus lacisoli TaxID=3064525 RepID=A0ABT9CG67_9BACL|nr:ATP-binding protein [Paenibacillus sp. JX-17]MDO7908267.1 ATP-binding protein [Paenibacillus sp. JX-17]
MNAVEHILLQVFLAGFGLILFPYAVRYTADESGKPVLFRNSYNTILAVCCILSILLCHLFQSGYRDGLIFDLGALPLLIGILYGRLRTGIIIAAAALLIHGIFRYQLDFSQLLLQTGVILYPFIFWAAGCFKRSGVQRKLRIFNLFVLVFCVLDVLFSTFSGWNTIPDTPHKPVFSLVYVIAGLAAGSLLLLHIETTHDHIRDREQARIMSRKYELERDKFRQFLDNVPLHVLTLDTRLEIVLINEVMLQFFRKSSPFLSFKDVVGEGIENFIAPNLVKRFRERIEMALDGQASQESVHSGPYIFYSHISPIRDTYKEEIVGVLVISQDMTEIEMLRSELGNVERLSLVGQMAASITHEIRNPMAVVRGFLQLMREKSPGSLDHYYRIVMEELDRANSIISDFLSLAQNRIVEKEEHHLHDIIYELTPLLWADANLRGQSIELKLDEDLPKLNLNPKEMKQLILNLSRNAMEAMDDKGVLTLKTASSGEQVLFEVHDTGPGIPKNKLDKLFEPFFTTKSTGTGLGLALCLSIVERHNGTITVDSEEGKGTAFRVAFRMERPMLRS